ncbi:26S proteasome regulatory subunit 6A homolog [Tasmannia lanceolata]|uniref:26S proteasome regulatory subunit 6A homolog n=1 Tax=Tasmannia lanceolata TaxID=3420 RepID=UPI004064C455
MNPKGVSLTLISAILAAFLSTQLLIPNPHYPQNLINVALSSFSSHIISTLTTYKIHSHHHHHKRQSTPICDYFPPDIPPPDTNTTSFLCVDRNGCCNFTTVQSAVDTVGIFSQKRTIIWINTGIYFEKVMVPRTNSLSLSLEQSSFISLMATAMVEDTNMEDDQLASMSSDDIVRASRLLDNEIRILREELQRTNLELESFKEKIKENQEKIKLNKQLPYLVGNIVEILEMNPEDEAEEDGANVDLDSQRKGKCVVLKTSTRQTIFLPVVGLVDPDKLKPGDLVGVNKDSYLILDTLPSEYDSRVKAMEVDEKPTEDYNDIGGLEKQIQELVEAIVLPMTHKERFQKLGVRPPKGVLLYGPPGTGKTLMARACAAQTNATFLKLAGPQLVQMFIGDGAKLVRDAFQLAKEKSPCIIFIDEIDAIGTKRFDSEVSGDREVQRTMLELLNQLDGFSSDDRIKVIAATNRADILDPALMRSGRLDRKIEFPHPTEDARARILQIHSRKMTVHPDVNFEELARSTDDFNGAQLKAVCVEAGMLALRRDATEVTHEDFNEGIIQVQAKKKASLNYYA